MWFGNTSSHLVDYVFNFVTVSFSVQILLILVKLSLSILSFYLLLSVSYLKQIHCQYTSWRFIPMLSLKGIRVLPVTLSLWFILNGLIYLVRGTGAISFSFTWISSCPSTTGETTFFPWMFPAPCEKGIGYRRMGLFVGS